MIRRIGIFIMAFMFLGVLLDIAYLNWQPVVGQDAALQLTVGFFIGGTMFIFGKKEI